MNESTAFLELFELQSIRRSLGWAAQGTEVEGESEAVASAEKCASVLNRLSSTLNQATKHISLSDLY